MPGCQQQPPNANANGRRTLTGRFSALSASLRMHSLRTQEGEEEAGQDEPGAWAETSTLVEYASSSSRGVCMSALPPARLLTYEQEQEFPWPRGRSREPRRGSHSTGCGGYGNIWAYSAQEQELLRAHAEARRISIPVGRGGYGNIAHARALAAEGTAAAARSQSVDPVAAPTSMPLPFSNGWSLTRARPRRTSRARAIFYLNANGRDDGRLYDADESDEES
ncbi:hypothetical protein C8J57DRAFT_1319611 [Mycena rebaudengoi]|nr:hypothetical protein C8J57DRAFT_1319611 [Mycena rebaudengoi]